MKAGPQSLRERTGVVLKTLVSEFIHTAYPVGSGDIARVSLLKVSPATIRNEMAELEEGGYIKRPHTSSGGVPSDKGYRYYVETMDELPELPVNLKDEIRDQFRQADMDMEVWVQTAASALSETLGNMVIVTLPRAEANRLNYIQLVYLQDFLALIVIVFRGATLAKQLLPLEEPTTQDELTKAANKLNENIAGLKHNEILDKQNELELTPLENKVRAQTLLTLKKMDLEASVGFYVDGLRLLLGQPEFDRTALAREVVGMVEERILINTMLAEAPGPGSVGVFIGEENSHEVLKPFTVVLSRYGVPQEASGTIGVVGPTRIGYETTIGGVRFLSSLMSRLMMGVNGRI